MTARVYPQPRGFAEALPELPHPPDLPQQPHLPDHDRLAIYGLLFEAGDERGDDPQIKSGLAQRQPPSYIHIDIFGAELRPKMLLDDRDQERHAIEIEPRRPPAAGRSSA
jgi:hypothetical protein